MTDLLRAGHLPGCVNDHTTGACFIPGETLPATVRDLRLNLTGVAQAYLLARSLIEETRVDVALLGGSGAGAYTEAWETLTGLTGDAALDAAQAITRHPLPVTAAVVPL